MCEFAIVKTGFISAVGVALCSCLKNTIDLIAIYFNIAIDLQFVCIIFATQALHIPLIRLLL